MTMWLGDVEMVIYYVLSIFFSSRRRHTRCALVTGVQTCALPIWPYYPGSAACSTGTATAIRSTNWAGWRRDCSADLRHPSFRWDDLFGRNSRAYPRWGMLLDREAEIGRAHV